MTGPNELRQLDLQGNPIESTLDYSLRSDGTLTPTDLTTFFGGALRYMADAASFTECLTGRRYPVAFEADWPSAERAYLATVTEPGGCHTTFEGSLVERPKMDGEGTEPTLVVSRFIAVWPGEGVADTATCRRIRPAVPQHLNDRRRGPRVRDGIGWSCPESRLRFRGTARIHPELQPLPSRGG